MPAPGPTSTTKSAARIVSSSCSTTMRVLPRSRSLFSVAISLSLSRWCRPIDGSSRIYSTPTSDEPICVASLIRWLSPPESVPAERDRVRYSSPTLLRKPRRDLISFIICSPISLSRSLISRFSKNSSAFATDL